MARDDVVAACEAGAGGGVDLRDAAVATVPAVKHRAPARTTMGRVLLSLTGGGVASAARGADSMSGADVRPADRKDIVFWFIPYFMLIVLW